MTTKNVSHISQRIICPKCGTKNLRKSISANNLGAEYFCDNDHEYFGINELCSIWGYDAGDFYSENGKSQLNDTEWLRVEYLHLDWLEKKRFPNIVLVDSFSVEEKVISTKWFDGEATYSCDEPVWSSGIARDESYEVVNRMFMDIEEWEDGLDSRDLPWPIGAVGGC